MRVNIYAEELTEEVTLVKKRTDDGRLMFGMRVYLHSTQRLEHSPVDDDRSAVTFWVPWSADAGYEPEYLSALVTDMSNAVVQLEHTIGRIEHTEEFTGEQL